MNVRSLAAVATVLACAFVAPSHAGKPVALDGVRRTHVTYEGSVSTPAFSPESAASGSTEANRADCTQTSCDVTAVRLTVPRGSAGGRFKAMVTMPPQLTVAVALYDARGDRAAYADLSSGSWTTAQMPYLQLQFTVPRLPAGNYTLVVFDRAGQGSFTVDLDYKALPPARKRG